MMSCSIEPGQAQAVLIASNAVLKIRVSQIAALAPQRASITPLGGAAVAPPLAARAQTVRVNAAHRVEMPATRLGDLETPF